MVPIFTQANSVFPQISKMGWFLTKINSCKTLANAVKWSILDVCGSPALVSNPRGGSWAAAALEPPLNPYN